MRSISTIACMSLFLASSALAQEPVKTRPDTLGANVPQSGPRIGTADGFDYLIGEWDFVFQYRNVVAEGAADTWSAPIPGKWTVRKTRDGLVVEDVFALEGTSDPTISWRVFNPTRRLWEMQGLKAMRGSWDPGISWGTGSERFVEQTFTGVSVGRIRYYNITPKSFSWRADLSLDNGKTWIRDAWLIEARRK